MVLYQMSLYNEKTKKSVEYCHKIIIDKTVRNVLLMNRLYRISAFYQNIILPTKYVQYEECYEFNEMFLESFKYILKINSLYFQLNLQVKRH